MFVTKGTSHASTSRSQCLQRPTGGQWTGLLLLFLYTLSLMPGFLVPDSCLLVTSPWFLVLGFFCFWFLFTCFIVPSCFFVCFFRCFRPLPLIFWPMVHGFWPLVYLYLVDSCPIPGFFLSTGLWFSFPWLVLWLWSVVFLFLVPGHLFYSSWYLVFLFMVFSLVVPNFWSMAPVTSFSCTWFLVSGFLFNCYWYLVSGPWFSCFWFLICGFWFLGFLVPGFWCCSCWGFQALSIVGRLDSENPSWSTCVRSNIPVILITVAEPLRSGGQSEGWIVKSSLGFLFHLEADSLYSRTQHKL